MFKRVYFVLAPSYHGATILSLLLNSHPKIVSLGDTYPSNRFDQICGCGAYVSKCQFWQKVKKRVNAESFLSCPHLLPLYPNIIHHSFDKYLYNFLSPDFCKNFIPSSSQQTFVRNYYDFLSVVYELESNRKPEVFVDGVKSISRVKALIASGFQVDGVIHLIRDPGDFAKSSMKQQGNSLRVLVKSAIAWRLYHNCAAKLKNYVPYLPITYEELGENTEKTVRKIFDFLMLPYLTISELLEGTKGRKWHFMGNASVMRFNGNFFVSRHKLSKFERLLIRIISGLWN